MKKAFKSITDIFNNKPACKTMMYSVENDFVEYLFN